jgi:hypothetical protein
MVVSHGVPEGKMYRRVRKAIAVLGTPWNPIGCQGRAWNFPGFLVFSK